MRCGLPDWNNSWGQPFGRVRPTQLAGEVVQVPDAIMEFFTHMSFESRIWLVGGNARLTDVKAMERTDRMGTRTDRGGLRVLVLGADYDQLNQCPDHEIQFSLPSSYCSAVDMLSWEEKIRRYPYSQNSKLPNVKPPRLDLLSAHPSHHNKLVLDPGPDLHTNVRPR